MSEQYKGKIHIRTKNGYRNLAEITDVETDGQLFFENVVSQRAERFVKIWNSYDKLLATCEVLTHLLEQDSLRPMLNMTEQAVVVKAKAAIAAAKGD